MLRVGIIGGGYGARVHLPCFSTFTDAKVTAVAGEGFSHLGGSLVRHFGRGEELASSSLVDVLSIAVPPQSQNRIAEIAIANGKSVLCEKPVGISREEATTLHKFADKHGVIAAAGFQFRFESGIAEMIRRARKGRIGKIRVISVCWMTGGGADPERPWTWRDDNQAFGGILREYGCHVFDYAEQIVGSSIRSVFCRESPRIGTRPVNEGRPRVVTSADEFEILCRFEEGVVGQFLASNAYQAPLGHRIEVFGSHGRLTFMHRPPFLPGAACLIESLVNGKETRIDLPEPTTIGEEDSRSDAFKRLAASFLRACRGETQPELPTFAHAAAAHAVVAAADLSAQTSKEVVIPASSL